MFLSEQPNKPEEKFMINKLSSSYKKRLVYNVPTKSYYHRPTPVDLQIEHRDEFNDVQFDGKTIS